MKSFFSEISDYQTYRGHQADFHFSYNANSGGGQAFLGGRFYDENAVLASPSSLNGRNALFVLSIGNGTNQKKIVLDDKISKYDIKPRGQGSTSMKLGVGAERVTPSRLIAAAMMLPPPCGVNQPSNLDYSILTSKNYWLQSMWLECEINKNDRNEVFLYPLDYIFAGGISRESVTGNARYFKLNVEERVQAIIDLAKHNDAFPDAIYDAVSYFASLYSGKISFDYRVCETKRDSLLKNLAAEFPSHYSGISDPLSVLLELAPATVGKSNTTPIATGIESSFPRNRIIFGAPGTGKSFLLNNDKKKLLGDNNDIDFERVTFHPDYSYANFVGTYKPVMVEKANNYSTDPETNWVISTLNDSSKTAQEKYDLLYDYFNDGDLTRLPILLGIYTDEPFKTRKQDGSSAANSNVVERNHGKSIRKYVAPIGEGENAGEISYEYVPGPFMRIYVNAVKSAKTRNPRPFLLIIEEINRANVAAVFGDIFQLLDRADDNTSEYSIHASEDIKKYLAKELGGNPEDYTNIKLPDNMFIWATMNSADQGVFPMDTAFKRRWEFTYLGIDSKDQDLHGKYVTLPNLSQRFEWNDLRKAINEFLANNKVNEDKQIGPYFISRDIVVPSDGGTEIDSSRFCDVFKHKVLMYLFEDAARQKRQELFSGSQKGYNRYSKICEAFDEQGIGIFNSAIQDSVPMSNNTDNE